MFTAHDSDKHWQQYGDVDPYFGVLSNEQFHTGRMSDAARETFFAFGQRQVAQIFETIHTHLDASFEPQRALDFGCGVGRLALPLAARVAEVVAVDVSEGMLAEARRNRDAAGTSNISFVRGDDQLSGLSGTFDLMTSYIVFQHIPTIRGLPLLARLLDRLSEGGVAVVHLTYGSATPLTSRFVHGALKYVPFAMHIYNIALRRNPFYPVMQTNYYDLNRVARLLQAKRCERVFTLFTRHERNLGLMLFAQKRAVTHEF